MMNVKQIRLAAILVAALAMSACANKPDENAQANAAGMATPGSQQDFVVNVGDRVFFETDSTELTPQSRATLEKGLGHPVRWFCYPAGRNDSASAAAVAKAGYLMAYTTEGGSTLRADQRETLPRVRVPGQGSVAAVGASVRAAS